MLIPRRTVDTLQLSKRKNGRNRDARFVADAGIVDSGVVIGMGVEAGRAVQTRMRTAKLRHIGAALEDVDFRTPRKLDRALFQQRATGRWIKDALNLMITGPCGSERPGSLHNAYRLELDGHSMRRASGPTEKVGESLGT